MRGILYDLAREGYLAAAADYWRRGVGSLFAWREPGDVRAALDVVRGDRRADTRRVGAMGYSQGGVYSLLLAAYTEDVRAVVAYYPVSDFEHWLDDPDRGWIRRLAFRVIRMGMRRRAGAKSEEEFREVLSRASPLRQTERIRAPVLLIHGDRDRTAGIDESRRLTARLAEHGCEVELLVVHRRAACSTSVTGAGPPWPGMPR
jgi:dipeptidyl aminopeptidase/acylaminoacyl peptidase